ncbi:hypothetical protein [uncultured Dokdonia sp.]|uniref:hypothetical protein n=1 Tax=uncultured Dokdonia sp. TaxID=575653 RepID=UPI002624AF1D|nr:hypothetical protein [uncultured Dokdonia sp.]
MRRKINTGDTVNGLLLVKEVQRINPKARRGKFVCNCGNEFEADLDNVKRGRTKSCGCLRRKLNSTKAELNKNSPRLSWTYEEMLKHPTSETYNQWVNDEQSFHKWSTENAYEQNKKLILLDESRGFEPDNCKWVDMSEYEMANGLHIRLHEILKSIKLRVYNSVRGQASVIKVDKKWVEDETTFFDWSTTNGYKNVFFELKRYNNKGDYAPENCYWIKTKSTKMIPTYQKKLTYSNLLSIRGSNLSVNELAHRFNISLQNAYDILNYKTWNTRESHEDEEILQLDRNYRAFLKDLKDNYKPNKLIKIGRLANGDFIKMILSNEWEYEGHHYNLSVEELNIVKDKFEEIQHTDKYKIINGKKMKIAKSIVKSFLIVDKNDEMYKSWCDSLKGSELGF